MKLRWIRYLNQITTVPVGQIHDRDEHCTNLDNKNLTKHKKSAPKKPLHTEYYLGTAL